MRRVVAVVLAAGASTRLGLNKLCVRLNGEAVVRRTVRLFMTPGIDEIVVVTGFEAQRVEKELSGLPVTFVHNEQRHDGMSSSIKAALPVVAGFDLVLFHLGDKPLLAPETIGRLLRAYGSQGSSIVVATHEGVKGHPVLVDVKRHMGAMEAIEGEWGLRDMIASAGAEALFVECGEGSVLDLDTEEDIALLRRRGYTIEKGQG
jgi:molybdenum cofactor cytidylyltransferase